MVCTHGTTTLFFSSLELMMTRGSFGSTSTDFSMVSNVCVTSCQLEVASSQRSSPTLKRLPAVMSSYALLSSSMTVTFLVTSIEPLIDS